MILVEVVQLIVNINGRLDWLINCDGCETNLSRRSTWAGSVAVELSILYDLVTHNVKGNAKGKEDHTKHSEGDHRRPEAGDWAPSWESLLLEAGVPQLFNLFSDTLSFLW